MEILLYICSHKFITEMEANILLKQWYDGLPKDTYLSVRDKIIEECGISRAVFYNWYCCVTPIPKLAQREIERIAEKEIFNQ